MGNPSSKSLASSNKTAQSSDKVAHKPTLSQIVMSSEKKMIVYNWVPKNFTRTKVSRRLAALVKRKRHMITSIRINKDTLGPNTNNSSDILRIISRMRGLKSIDIDFWGNNSLKKTSLVSLAKSLRPLKDLKFFTISNHDPDMESLNGASLIIKNFSLLRKIKEANLVFSDCLHNNLREEAVKNLLKRVGRLRKVQSLGVDLSSCEFLTNEGLQLFGRRLTRFAELEELKLDLSYCPSICTTGIKMLFENISILSLSEFKMKFGGHRIISDQELVIISSKLAKMTRLRSLGLTFDGYDSIKQEGFGYLIEGINELKNLRQLELDLSGCKNIADYELTNVTQNLQFFERLVEFSLYLPNTSTSDIGIIHLAQNLPRLEKIRKLNLSFGGYENLMNHALMSLGSSLSKLKGLRVLNFEFSKTKITDVGVEKFMLGISELKELLELKIGLCQNQELTGKSVTALSVYLLKLEKLTSLEVDFSYCVNVTSEGVLNLVDAIPKLKKLSNTSLRFQSCIKLNKAAQDVLKHFDN